MADLSTFRNEVALVVNSLARAVVTEIFSAVEGAYLNRQSLEAEEKLGALVEHLCFEAVEKILKLVNLSVMKSGENVGQMHDGSDDVSETAGGEGGGGAPFPPSEQTYILVYENAAADSQCVLVSLESHANGGNESTCDVTGQGTELSPSSSAPQADDHEYARSTSPPSSSASAAVGGVRKRPRGRRKRARIVVSGEATETHLQCSHCAMLFPNSERLADHEKKAHPACSVCGLRFTGVLKLREHELKKHGLLPYICDFCPKRFNHKAHRDLHVKARHTGEKSCHCDICGKGYACVSVLKTHRITHFDKSFICDVCGKGFYHACHLTRHKLVHQEVRPFRCPTCGKGFTQAANLRSHQATHTGERQLCSICGKSFRCLKNHVISKHSHELPADELPAVDAIVSCEVCGKKFPNPSQYRAHQRSHTGEKPFHCDICGKSYRLKELLRDHRYTHTGEKPYRCSLCPKTFNLATSFMRHRSIHSGEMPYSCRDCGKHFRLFTFLKAHLQTKAHVKQTGAQGNAPPPISSIEQEVVPDGSIIAAQLVSSL
ncbi:zinc finger protein 708-like isoform X1 [Astatotilapia calliptera]|uniref:C2H2-type domain-containing protein n=1 Tax=Astatotilapia calliptera TaxID=8154 RepID=A0A3P8NKX8_ASTCA|nr:zinc finger protein 708-like isoform X1 [Astatotilapia calliptera]